MIISNRLEGKNFLSFPHHQGKNENSRPVGQEFLYHQGENRNSCPPGREFLFSPWWSIFREIKVTVSLPITNS